jgi:hypothetical protein
LCAGVVGAKFCADCIGRESRGGVFVGGFDSTSGGLVGDAAAMPDVATGVSKSCDAVPIAEFNDGPCGRTIAGGVDTFDSNRGSLFAFDSASCKFAAGI